MRLNANATEHKVPGTVDAVHAEIPKAARKAFERGVEKSQKGKGEEAIQAFQDALSHYPDYFDAMNDLAVEYIKLDRCQEAFPLLDRAVKLEPGSPQPHINLGIAFNKQKRYNEAIEELAQAIHLDFNNPLAHFQLGFACLKISDLMRAQLEFEITIESKKIPLARLYLADLYKRKDRTSEAIAQIEAFLREAPNHQFAETARKELAQLKQSH